MDEENNYIEEDQCNPAAGVEDYVSQSQRCAFSEKSVEIVRYEGRKKNLAAQPILVDVAI
jgi:hypothetical protein